MKRQIKVIIPTVIITVLLIIVGIILYREVFTFRISYNSAEYDFSVTPETDIIKSDSEQMLNGFYIDTLTTLTGGRLRYWGSSTVVGGTLKVYSDDNVLYEEPIPYCEDYVLINLHKGDTVKHRHYFRPQDGEFPCGIYDIEISFGDSSQIFKEALTVECKHDYTEVSCTDKTIKYVCRKCGDITESDVCVDWWFPISEYERQFVGNFISNDGKTMLMLNQWAAGSFISGLDENNNFTSEKTFYWWLGTDKILFVKQRKIFYDDGEVTTCPVHIDGDKLYITHNNITYEFTRTDIKPQYLYG